MFRGQIVNVCKGFFTHTSFRTAKRSFPRELQAVFFSSAKIIITSGKEKY